MRVEFPAEEFPFPNPRSELARKFVLGLVQGGESRGVPYGVLAEGDDLTASLTKKGLRIEGEPEDVLKVAEGVVSGGCFTEVKPRFPLTWGVAVDRAARWHCRLYQWDPAEGLRELWWWEVKWSCPDGPERGLGYVVIPLRVRKSEADLVAAENDWDGEKNGVLYLETDYLGRKAMIAFNPEEAEMLVIVDGMWEKLDGSGLRDLGRQIAGASLRRTGIRSGV